MTLTTQTDDTAEASPCWVTVLFSHRGATDGDESGLAEESMGQSHTVILCSCTVLQITAEAYTRRPSIHFTAPLSSQFISELCSQF